MMKTCLFFILVLLMQPIFAASLMTHEKFVHLNYEDQRKIVVATMELIVEMEEKYEHQVRTSGYNEERFRRYSELIRKVSSVIFPEAHAARTVRYERIGEYMEKFKLMINSSDKCIYGGWPSSMNGNLCVHPSNGAYKNDYFSENNCQGINQISCNPAIFGFKHVGRATLFCVSAGRSGSAADAPSDNTSRECMKKALAPSTDPNVSPPAVRIANLVDGIRRNPVDSNAVFDFLLKSCACEARTPAISQHYHTYMRPHRTCFSILKMMSEVMPECSASITPMSEQQSSFLANIRNSISQDEINSATPNTIDAVYSQVVNGFVSRPEYASICGTTPGPGPTPTPTPRCSAPDLELENGECCVPPLRPDDRRATCVPAGGITVTSCTPPQIPNPATPGACMDPQGGTTACTPPQIPNPATPGACMDPAGGGGGGVTTACTPPQIPNPATPGACMDPVGGGGGDTQACTPPQVPNPATPGACMDPPARTCDNGANNFPACNACTAPKVYIGESCRDACPEGVGERNPTTFACSEQCTDTTKEYVRVTNSCQTKCVAPETRNEAGICGAASSGNTIVVKSTIKDLNSTKITVTINGGATLIPGHTIIWFKKGTNITNLTFTGTDGTPAATPDPLAGAIRDDEPATQSDPPPATTPTNETWDDAGTDETSIPRTTDDLEFTAPRHTENYEVCARLVKVSDRSIASTDCEIVQKKTAPAPTGGFNPGQQQMGPTRGGASDAIFRGIR